MTYKKLKRKVTGKDLQLKMIKRNQRGTFHWYWFQYYVHLFPCCLDKLTKKCEIDYISQVGMLKGIYNGEYPMSFSFGK
jgi:hypothetical protein